MYEVHLGSRAAKALRDCSPGMRGDLLHAIEALGRQQRPPGSKKLSGALEGSYRIRVGSYRVIYDIYDRDHAVLITKIGPRKSVYR
ncbi:type II toxin-antitoxin system RelE/ParE family toxin [Elusimicrobiota bacterium]